MAARFAVAGSAPARRFALRRLRFLDARLSERQAGGCVSVTRTLYRAPSSSSTRMAAGWRRSRPRIFACRPAAIGQYAFGAPPELVGEGQIRSRRLLRSQSCQRAVLELPYNKPLQLTGRGFCQAECGGRTAARFYCSRVCS